MRQPVDAAGLREILLRHDPLAAWPEAGPNPDGYQLVAEVAAGSLQRMLGAGHAWTVVADAIDLQHPGFYRALQGDDAELRRRVGLVAREIWDRHGLLIPRPAVERPAPAGPLPEPPPPPAMVAETELLEDWLRVVEAHLDAEATSDRAERPAASALQAALPGLVDAYAAADAGEREAARLAFSRFRLCCHQLSTFVGRQHALLDGRDAAGALRRALVGESLLDRQVDWRDELLTIQWLKRRADELGLPYAELIEEAASLSSPATARLLRGA